MRLPFSFSPLLLHPLPKALSSASVPELYNKIGYPLVRSLEITPEPYLRFVSSLPSALHPVNSQSPTSPVKLQSTPLPPLWHWLYTLPGDLAEDLTDEESGEDGLRKVFFMSDESYNSSSTSSIIHHPSSKGARRVWGGGECTFFHPIFIGDRLLRETTIVNVEDKIRRRIVSPSTHNQEGGKRSGDGGNGGGSGGSSSKSSHNGSDSSLNSNSGGCGDRNEDKSNKTIDERMIVVTMLDTLFSPSHLPLLHETRQIVYFTEFPKIESNQIPKIVENKHVSRVQHHSSSTSVHPSSIIHHPSSIIHHLSSISSFSLTATSTLMFKYSALTFNSHRIHYDVPYTQNVEGYPSILVPGPLIATLSLLPLYRLLSLPQQSMCQSSCQSSSQSTSQSMSQSTSQSAHPGVDSENTPKKILHYKYRALKPIYANDVMTIQTESHPNSQSAPQSTSDLQITVKVADTKCFHATAKLLSQYGNLRK